MTSGRLLTTLHRNSAGPGTDLASTAKLEKFLAVLTAFCGSFLQ